MGEASKVEDKAGWQFRDWYHSDKGRAYNEKRKLRYKTDPEYREAVLRMNKENRKRKQEERRKEGEQRKKAAKVTAVPSWKEVEQEIEGKKHTLMTISAVAKALGRSPQSIRLYEKHGLIPPTPHRAPRGDRLYTPEQVLEIYKVAKSNVEAKLSQKDDIHPKYVTIEREGVQQELTVFYIGALAKAVGRQVLTLENLERAGVLPETPLRDPKTKRRFYTASMIERVREAYKLYAGDRLRGDENKQGFRSHVLSAWAAEGVDEKCNIVSVRSGTEQDDG